jgi:hypothetical protein
LRLEFIAFVALFKRMLLGDKVIFSQHLHYIFNFRYRIDNADIVQKFI